MKKVYKGKIIHKLIAIGRDSSFVLGVSRNMAELNLVEDKFRYRKLGTHYQGGLKPKRAHYRFKIETVNV